MGMTRDTPGTEVTILINALEGNRANPSRPCRVRTLWGRPKAFRPIGLLPDKISKLFMDKSLRYKQGEKRTYQHSFCMIKRHTVHGGRGDQDASIDTKHRYIRPPWHTVTAPEMGLRRYRDLIGI